jgi:hypothetical protein
MQCKPVMVIALLLVVGPQCDWRVRCFTGNDVGWSIGTVASAEFSVLARVTGEVQRLDVDGSIGEDQNRRCAE